MDYLETKKVSRGTPISVNGKVFYLEEDADFTSHKDNWVDINVMSLNVVEKPKIKAIK